MSLWSRHKKVFLKLYPKAQAVKKNQFDWSTTDIVDKVGKIYDKLSYLQKYDVTSHPSDWQNED